MCVSMVRRLRRGISVQEAQRQQVSDCTSRLYVPPRVSGAHCKVWISIHACVVEGSAQRNLADWSSALAVSAASGPSIDEPGLSDETIMAPYSSIPRWALVPFVAGANGLPTISGECDGLIGRRGPVREPAMCLSNILVT
jgi:hypothetical protein